MASSTDCTEIIEDPSKLFREGTSQAQRQLAALKPGYVKVDEHQSADWMVFAQRYAEFIQFFNEDNKPSGDWRAFFNQESAAILAVAAVQDVDYFKTNSSNFFKVLLGPTADIDTLKKNFGHVFNVLATLAWQLEWLKESLPKDVALKNILQNSIQSELAVAFARLIAYYKAALEKPENNVPPGILIDVNSDDYGWDILGGKIGQFPELYKKPFTSDWYKHSGLTSWEAFHQSITSNDRIFGGTLISDVAEKLNFAAAYNLFTGILDLFIKTYSRAVSEAQKNLDKSLSEKDDHSPHYALFLAFIRLLQFSRDHVNSLTARHLDFYYQQVLRLKQKPAEPNQAHLILQLAKHKSAHQLKSGAEFNAGKDSQGQEVVYRLADEIVANTAIASQLKSVNLTASKLYAFPVSNSDDGRGAELTSPLKQWHPFTGLIEPENLAKLGFAVSSHYLLLGEGNRIVQLNLAFEKKFFPKKMSSAEFCNAFDFYFTGTKGWVKATWDKTLGKPKDFPPKVLDEIVAIEIALLLVGSQPSIVPLKADIHGNDLPEGLPTLKAILKQENTASLSYQTLQNLTIKAALCSLDVSVGYRNLGDTQPDEAGTGLKKLRVVNKFGEIKLDKPFQPFGALPEKGDYLIIGSDEMFQKKNAQIQFNLDWKGLPEWRGDIDFDWVNEFAPSVKITFLKNGIWDATNPDLDGVEIFNGTEPNVYFPQEKKLSVPPVASSEVHFDEQPYQLDRRNGFVKLALNGDFGHKLYQATLSRYMLRVALKETMETDKGKLRDAIYDYDAAQGKYVPKPQYRYNFNEKFIEEFSKAFPNEPYTPQIESFTLNYSASVKLSEENTGFFWINPFGYQKSDATKLSLRLLPQFNAEGEFYIGMEGFKPPQAASLLFQVAEGSADPNLKKPDNHVQWSYLKDNEWVDFKETEISDATGQLIRSGIIRFAVPKDATDHDTLFLAPGTHWLRAKVDSQPNAVCKIITVTAQAALAVFKDQGNASDFLSNQLPGESITKLVIPDAAIKKIGQPYPTFGGRPQENSDQFYTRVSERLRHKNRAINLWDYERLILEAFPNIYKVKCLNHMRLEPDRDGNKSVHNELAPGHVTIVTIPIINHLNAVDPLKPYTSLGDLELITQFLARHVSCFVKLHVSNPIFEEVRVDFKVKFYPGRDESFHRELLLQELIGFLSPWAFSDNNDLTFGGKVYKSSLINFVEERDYVDYVTDFQLFHRSRDGSGDNVDVEEAVASTALSILVSASAERHKIQVIPGLASTVQDQFCQC